MPEFTGTALHEVLGRLPPAPVYRVAFSGGLDSTVLLHALAGLRGKLAARLCAVHINHGLHGNAEDWERHCRATCDAWSIEYRSFTVDARPARGQSPEERARESRYAQLRAELNSGEILMTAHHQDDQAETLLMQLCRGAGPAGLSGMPMLRAFGSGFHARPLLGWSRTDLANYAAANDLRWVDDPANANPAFDRNFIRRQLLPVLRERWSAIGATLGRAAAIQAEIREILQDVAVTDLDQCRGAGAHPVLLVDRVGTLTEARQLNLFRYWLASLSLPPPARVHLEAMRRQLLASRRDAMAAVRWPGAEVRRYSGELWAFAPLCPRDARDHISWRIAEPCALAHGTLSATLARGRGLRRDALDHDQVEVRFRHGGEHLLPVGDRHHRALKKLLQQARIPPWLRGRLPLLFSGERLVAVADLWMDADLAASAAESGWEFVWRDHALRPAIGPA